MYIYTLHIFLPYPLQRADKSEFAKETQNFNTFLHGMQNSVPIQLVTWWESLTLTYFSAPAKQNIYPKARLYIRQKKLTFYSLIVCWSWGWEREIVEVGEVLEHLLTVGCVIHPALNLCSFFCEYTGLQKQPFGEPMGYALPWGRRWAAIRKFSPAPWWKWFSKSSKSLC